MTPLRVRSSGIRLAPMRMRQFAAAAEGGGGGDGDTEDHILSEDGLRLTTEDGTHLTQE